MRRHLPVLALLALALAVVAVPAPAGAVDPHAPRGTIPTPAVGDCHALTAAEATEDSDPDAPVPCTDPHTSMTVRVVTLTDPDWSNAAALWRKAGARCYQGMVATLGSAKKGQLSAYDIFWFIPTQVERDAGASWVRCDVALMGVTRLLPLPLTDDLTLGSLPLPDGLARCRAGKRAGFAVTACSKKHAFRASLAIKYPAGTFPGLRASKRYALRKCRARMTTDYIYEWVPSKQAWNGGLRFAVCLPRNRS